MTTRIHILHLSSAGLSWVSLEGRFPKGKIVDRGSLDGEATTCLDGWLPGKSGKDSEIYLYDSRPQYFSFIASLPVKAAKESAKIVPLRVRQEIGLGEEALRWSTINIGAKDGQVNFLVIVARNESQDDLAQWHQKTGIKTFWAGSDIAAIQTLRENKILDETGSVAVKSRKEVFLYSFLEDGRIDRGAAASIPQNIDSAKIALIGLSVPEAEKVLTGISGRLSSEEADRALARFKAKLPQAEADKANNLDTVLLGGLLDAGFKRPSVASIFGGVDYASAFSEFEKKLKVRPLAIASAACVLLLLVSFAFAKIQRGADTAKAKEQADKLDDMTALYNKQSDVLSRVKSDRFQMIPFIEAVYKIAPADSTLQSLDIAENGLMVIAATTKTQEAGTAFFKDLAGTNFFDDIQITYLKLDDGKKWVRLQINAKIRGWKKR